ncbi:MAG TPA: hypothetical protein VGS96_05885 [Thermoanaerobaculia bacterium]|jgi:hypothetical protein|nr:hypothetical protein [Thermoanaerobaculia bacterium]
MALIFVGGLAEGLPRRRGPFVFYYGPSRAPFAFHYESSLSEEALAWYSQFDLLITHDPLPRDQVNRLHAAGTKLLFYEWSVAFYESRATKWQRSLRSHRQADLLNEVPLTGATGSTTSAAWYFDPASPEHEFGRARDIARRIEEAGYDGVFFDTTTVDSVHPEARKEYERRHPETPYDAAFSRFLVQLRKRLPNAVLFTNQGYRKAAYYLPYVDWDLTESVITGPSNGLHQLRPWNDPADPWSSSHFVMRTEIEPIAARYPHVRFGHLNYADGSSPETIRLVVAAAQLFGGDGYVVAPATAEEIDPIYFRNPGKPVSLRFDGADGKTAYRFFEHGLIAVTAANEEITIRNIQRKTMRDHVTGELTCGDVITIPAAAGGPRAFFFDYDESSRCSS